MSEDEAKSPKKQKKSPIYGDEDDKNEGTKKGKEEEQKNEKVKKQPKKQAIYDFEDDDFNETTDVRLESPVVLT